MTISSALSRARNLADHVVAGLAFGIDVVDDVELQLDVFAVGQQAFDAAVIVVAQDQGGHGLRGIVGAMLLGHDDAVAARRVVQAHHRAAGEQHGVELLADLCRGQAVGIGVLRRGRHRRSRRVRDRRWGCRDRTAPSPAHRRGAWRAGRNSPESRPPCRSARSCLSPSTGWPSPTLPSRPWWGRGARARRRARRSLAPRPRPPAAASVVCRAAEAAVPAAAPVAWPRR